MKTRLTYLIGLIAFVLFSQSAIAQKIQPLLWLVGTWQIPSPTGTTVEQWKPINDSTLFGKSYFVKSNGDTIPQETIELRIRKGQWAFIPTVSGQNNNQPTIFSVIFIGKEEFISTNPAHDFPQRITYRRIKNQLLASIEGTRKGRYTKQNFDFQLQ